MFITNSGSKPHCFGEFLDKLRWCWGWTASKAPSSLTVKNPIRNKQNRNSKTLTLMGIPVQCSPKGNRQLFPFSLWYPTANYRHGKWNSWNRNCSNTRVTPPPTCSHWQGTELRRNSGTKVKPELDSRPAPVASRLPPPETKGCKRRAAVEFTHYHPKPAPTQLTEHSKHKQKGQISCEVWAI